MVLFLPRLTNGVQTLQMSFFNTLKQFSTEPIITLVLVFHESSHLTADEISIVLTHLYDNKKCWHSGDKMVDPDQGGKDCNLSQKIGEIRDTTNHMQDVATNHRV